MTQFEIYALIAFMVGVVIKRFVNSEFGDTVEVIGAVVFVIAWLVSFIR